MEVVMSSKLIISICKILDINPISRIILVVPIPKTPLLLPLASKYSRNFFLNYSVNSLKLV